MSIIDRPAPYISQESVDDAIGRLKWRRSLSDIDCRSLAYEYRTHQKAVERGEEELDECLADAWAEYQQRFGGSPHTEFLKKAKIGRSSRQKRQGRSQSGSVSPLYNERGELI